MNDRIGSAPGHRFTGIYAHGANIFVRGVLTELDEKQIPHTFVLTRCNGQWTRFHLHNAVTSQCVTAQEENVFSLCLDGTIEVTTRLGKPVEIIELNKLVQQRRVWMWAIGEVGDEVFAVGMPRMAFKRDSSGHWRLEGTGAELTPEDSVDAGFRSFDAFLANELIAVGLDGEIWRYAAGIWMRLASPTNVRLEKIRYIGSQVAYACGGAGVILRGAGDSWSVVEQNVTDDTFWDIATFQGRVFFSTTRAVYELSGDDELKAVSDLSAPPGSTQYLAAARDELWSVGGATILTYNGQDWRRPSHPLDAKL